MLVLFSVLLGVRAQDGGPAAEEGHSYDIGAEIDSSLMPQGRLYATTSTSTKYVVTTSTYTTTISTTCFVTVGVTGACRKKRNMEEKPIILSALDPLDSGEMLDPTAPETVQATRAAELPSQEESQLTFSPATPEVSGSGVTEMEVRGLEMICGRPRSFFGLNFSSLGFSLTSNPSLFAINFVYYTTATVTTTTTSSTSYGTVTFYVSLCTPSGFSSLYTACTALG